MSYKICKNCVEELMSLTRYEHFKCTNGSHASTFVTAEQFLRIFWRTSRPYHALPAASNTEFTDHDIKTNEPYHADNVLIEQSQSVLVSTCNICNYKYIPSLLSSKRDGTMNKRINERMPNCTKREQLCIVS